MLKPFYFYRCSNKYVVYLHTYLYGRFPDFRIWGNGSFFGGSHKLKVRKYWCDYILPSLKKALKRMYGAQK